MKSKPGPLQGVTITRVDGLAIPTVRERGVPRRGPQVPDPAPAATAMLKALRPGNEALIPTALFALGVVLAKVELGTNDLPIRMPRAQQTAYRRLERRYRAALPKLSRERMRALCVELGGEEEPTPAELAALQDAIVADEREVFGLDEDDAEVEGVDLDLAS
jgi:hypothetical protein